MSVESLKDRAKDFPVTPGIYLMKSRDGKIIYIGKAKNLKNRVRSYFNDSPDHTPKTRLLVSHIRDIEYILTKTEVEAFLLEASLIKKHRPKYNIRLKDDKSYPYIKLSWSDAFPRLYLARKVKRDGSLYFGPYTSGGAVFGTIRFLNRTFNIRDCTDSIFKSRKRPCMTHQIGRCTAPCVGLINEENYREEVGGAKSFLKGENKKVLRLLKDRMKLSASEEKFEVAANLRDSIVSIEKVLQKQAVINAMSDGDQDVVGFFGDERGCLVETLHIRQGRLIGSRPHFLPMVGPQDDVREWMVDFLNQYYDDNYIPDEVILPIELGLDLIRLMQDVLFERSGNKVIVRFATEGRGQNLTEIANANAKSHFEKHVDKSEEKKKGLEEIQDKLGLKAPPHRIECFDISHFQGSETVASQVVYEDGSPSKDHYRRYKIKTVPGIDDFASMQEVLSRRLKHEEYEDPDLIVIDGGKGQLSAVMRILKDLHKEHLPVVGLAKARTESEFAKTEVESSQERFYLPGRANPVIFRDNSEAFRILVGIRDEAHRFAIQYHRKLREAGSIESELDEIGLNEAVKRELLTYFANMDELREADVSEIAKVPGVTPRLAAKIKSRLNEELPAQGENIP